VRTTLITIILLTASNVFMTFAWYGHLKHVQEVVTLSVFIPFAILYMKERPRLDYLWAGLCLLGAVYFAFRKG
jgi:uncharacterized protein (DUF486 family)